MKKALCMLLVLVLTLGMSTVAFAAYEVTKTEGAPYGFASLWVGAPAAGRRPVDKDFEINDMEPDTAQWFYPVASDTAAATGGTYVTGGAPEAFNVTYAPGNEATRFLAAQARGLYPWKALKDVKMRTRVQKGSSAIRDIQFLETNANNANNVAGIRLRSVKHLKDTDEDGVDFEILIYPTVDGNTWDHEEYGFTISGNVVNDFVDIDGGTAYVDLYNHMVAVAEEAIKDIDYDLGPQEKDHTVIVHGRAANGASYWGYSTTDATTAQEKIMSDHDIDVVYNLDYIGLDRVAKHVTLDVDATTYVYDADLKYLGRGNSELPLSKVYYVTYNEIVAAEEPAPEPEFPEPEVDLPAPSPGTGGFGAPEGPFENPSTGV